MPVQIMFWIPIILLPFPAHAGLDGQNIHIPSPQTGYVSKNSVSRVTLLDNNVSEKEDLAISKFSDWFVPKKKM